MKIYKICDICVTHPNPDTEFIFLDDIMDLIDSEIKFYEKESNKLSERPIRNYITAMGFLTDSLSLALKDLKRKIKNE